MQLGVVAGGMMIGWNCLGLASRVKNYTKFIKFESDGMLPRAQPKLSEPGRLCSD